MAFRVVLMGTGEFALPSFRALIEAEDYETVAVYTQPDRTGRGHHSHVNRVKELAQEHNIPVFQPPNVNTPEALDELRALDADVFIVAAYGQILKPAFLAIPPLGAFNLHGSLLPRHRGAAPVQYSIWKGDKLAGVTIFQIEQSLDSGPMIGKVETEIRPAETSGDLMLRLAELSVELTLTAVSRLKDGTAEFEPQDESFVTLAPKIRKEDGVIDWSQSAFDIECQIRAMQPWPKASSRLHSDGRKPLRCIILKSQICSDTDSQERPPGSLWLEGKRVFVATSVGVLEVLTIHPEGKKAMDATAFINGYGISNATFRSSPE